jgi:hypothetical protein
MGNIVIKNMFQIPRNSDELRELYEKLLEELRKRRAKIVR